MSAFIFTTCQVGVEAVLKQEVLTFHRDFRFAFSRPGFMTFKVPEPPPLSFASPSHFALSWGSSLGRAETPEEVFELVLAQQATVPWRLQVYPRETARAHTHGSPETEVHEQVRGVEGRLLQLARERASSLFWQGSQARVGDRVLDVLVHPGEPLFVGQHQHTAGRSPWPGGAVPVEVLPEAPSRAYYKFEEARLRFGIPFKEGDTAVEVGSAPGGAALALLRQGVRVIGIDPMEMNPAVLSYEGPGGARLTHIAQKAGDVRWEQLPRGVDWLLLDMNLAPQVALHAFSRLAVPFRRSISGVILTLKLNDWKTAALIPELLARVGELVPVKPVAVQLPSSGQEICVVGLSERGEQRLRGRR